MAGEVTHVVWLARRGGGPVLTGRILSEGASLAPSGVLSGWRVIRFHKLGAPGRLVVLHRGGGHIHQLHVQQAESYGTPIGQIQAEPRVLPTTGQCYTIPRQCLRGPFGGCRQGREIHLCCPRRDNVEDARSQTGHHGYPE